MHLRRTEYLKYSDTYINLYTSGYYNILDKIGHDYEKIIIFTDDKDFCLKYFNKYDISYGNEIEDFIKMSYCHTNIIANSSFSWWASFLGRKNKIVYAPKKWFNNNLCETDLYRKEMILL